MPYKSERIIIAGTHNDGRIKLTEQDKADIRTLHESGVSIRQITRMYGVNRRLIQFILFPERQELNKELRKKRGGWSRYYKRKVNTTYIRKWRRRKQKLFVEGKINIDGKNK